MKKKYSKIFIVIICLLLVIASIILILAHYKTVAYNEIVNDENKIELSCNEYMSFDNKLTCKISLTVASNQQISSISTKLSEKPALIENLLDDSYESNIMSEDGYVDVILGNDINTNTGAIKLDIAKVTFENMTTDKIINISNPYFIGNGGYNMFAEDMKIVNPNTASKKVEFSINSKTSAHYVHVIDDKYIYFETVSSNDMITGGGSVLKNAITSILDTQEVITKGCTYKLSDDGLTLMVADNYGNKRNYKNIYVSPKEVDYMLPWHISKNIYTRGYVTPEAINKNLIYTNGYFVLEDNKIKLYGDSSYTDLLDTRNWYYIKGTYDFTNTIINIPGTVSYNEFIGNIETNGVTVKLYNNSNGEITSGNLSATNILRISGIPGIGTEDITINTGVTDYIKFNNLATTKIDDNNYVVSGIDVLTGLDKLIENIDTNSTFKIYSENTLISPEYYPNNLVTTNMYMEISLNSQKIHYNFAVLGDLVGSGTVYLGDVVKLYKINKNKIVPTEAEKIAGDVVNDGNIDLLDVAKLYRYYRKVEPSLK